MDSPLFSRQALIDKSRFSTEDFAMIRSCRRAHNQLGFAYQLAFVKLINRFPETNPFELDDSVMTYVSYQVSIDASDIRDYHTRFQTIYEHQQRICDYLYLTKWSESQVDLLAPYLFEQALRTDQMAALKALARTFLLQQTYSTRFHEFALEFYSFVADNYAPFYSIPIECNDRDAAYVLDGLLYNETDLALEEHYTDTHSYTEINFAAFAMLGKQFAPRIRNIQHQHIYRISKNKDYQQLTPLVAPSDRAIRTDWIEQEWDRMGQFYASLEKGHVTASTALKRLVGFSDQNHFYRANRELGRVFKTEYILNYLSDPLLRQRNRRGLQKGEQMHALAREVNYGKRGRLGPRDWEGQRNAANCLTLILASIIYWQAKEINRALIDIERRGDTTLNDELIAHISPIGWDNIILYGEYIIDPHRIKR